MVAMMITITIAEYNIIGVSSLSSASLKDTNSDSMFDCEVRSSASVLKKLGTIARQFIDLAPDEFAYHNAGISLDSPAARLTNIVTMSASSFPS